MRKPSGYSRVRPQTAKSSPAAPGSPAAVRLRCGRIVLTTSIVVALLASLSPVEAAETEPLHQKIDRLIAAATPDYEALAAPVADDAEFLRRVTLDLTGRIPTIDQIRAFLADAAPDKRARVVDQLLASPEYARHMQNVFDVMLMRRLPAKHVATAEWETFLRESFAQNKPWDRMVREILSADGTDPQQRGPARFYLDRDGEPNEITRDVGRLFLGANLECAQCHHHPEIDDFRQEHYYGISAFLVRSFVFVDPKKKEKPVFAEKGEGEVAFNSVFASEKTEKERTTPPRVFDGMLVKDPELKEEDLYIVKPAKDVRPVPKYSRRSQLADAIATPDNPRFARTAANRLWGMMLGRGLIHPVDYDHNGNPPSHPELLELLASEFAAGKFDIRLLLREIALSNTYQRSSRRVVDGQPAPPVPEHLFAQAILKPLTPAQFAWAVLEATGQAEAQRKALGDKATEEAIHAKLVSYENRFVQLFGGLPGEPPQNFESTADQVLFLSNDGLIQGLVKSNGNSLAGRLASLSDGDAPSVADELFLSVLTRKPTGQDVQNVAEFLKDRTAEDRTAALEELVWALVTSAEFRFNH